MTARTLAPFDPEVIRPWHLGDGPHGALLIHGFAGTPPELRRLGEALAARGFRCYAPMLPGHGTKPEDLERTRWRDWSGAVAAAFDELAAECRDVVVAGQSMGGTLALHLAAHDLRVRAVAALAAPVWLSGPLPPLLPVIKRVVRWHRAGDDVDLWLPDAVEELYSYGIRPTRSIDELRKLCAVVRNELAAIRAPVLVIHGERDRSIDPRCGRERPCDLSSFLAAVTGFPLMSTTTASTTTSCSGSSASSRRSGRLRPRDAESAGVASGFEQPSRDVGIEDGVRQGAGIEVAMPFRGMALRHLSSFARRVAYHVTTAEASQHRGGHTLAGVLAMRETHVAAAFRATPARLGLTWCVDAHQLKRTAWRSAQ